MGRFPAHHVGEVTVRRQRFRAGATDKFLGGGETLRERQGGFRVDDLPLAVDHPVPVLRGGVPDRNVAAPLEPVPDLAIVPAVLQPGDKCVPFFSSSSLMPSPALFCTRVRVTASGFLSRSSTSASSASSGSLREALTIVQNA